jgi:hypothetical protein
MGELYLDSIDRVLMQEYQRCHDGCYPEETAKAIENIKIGQKIPTHILWRLSPHNDYAFAHKR